MRAHPDRVRRAVTATTRPPRPGEVDGRDYHFLAREKFAELLAGGYFIEYNRFSGNYYGTPRRALVDDLGRGGVVVLVIDVHGAEAVRGFFPEAPRIFVVPPTPGELRRRLEKRGTEDRDEMERRIAIAEGEMLRIREYNFIVVNRHLPAALRDLEAVIHVARRSLPLGREAEEWRGGRFSEWEDGGFV
ncbi:MAG: guanylate kinase [Planctomycetota bacterium]|nr:guanylate kinase [Planctomycetota bacterium]